MNTDAITNAEDVECACPWRVGPSCYD